MKAGERVQRAVAAVERASATSASADELLERVAGELRTYIPHDASMVFGIDPVTMIATEPSRIEGMDAALCDVFWHLEFHEQDTALFTDLASGEPVSAMRLSLGDRTARSIRFRDFMRPQGFGDELRGALQTGHHTWGVLGLYRDTVHAPFAEEDLEIVRRDRRSGRPCPAHLCPHDEPLARPAVGAWIARGRPKRPTGVSQQRSTVLAARSVA